MKKLTLFLTLSLLTLIGTSTVVKANSEMHQETAPAEEEKEAPAEEEEAPAEEEEQAPVE